MRLKVITAPVAVFLLGLMLSPMMAMATGHNEVNQTCGPSVTVVVAPGQNLFRIALAYGTTVAAIAQANNIANPDRIFAGQTLVIPCPNQPAPPSQPSLPPALPNPYFINDLAVVLAPLIAYPVALVQNLTVPLTADCTGFRATSPLDGFATESNIFFWDPAPGATGYRVNVYNLGRLNGAITGSFDTGPNFTFLSANLGEGSIGPGFLFAWEAQALVNDQVVCTTPRVTLFRESP